MELSSSPCVLVCSSEGLGSDLCPVTAVLYRMEKTARDAGDELSGWWLCWSCLAWAPMGLWQRCDLAERSTRPNWRLSSAEISLGWSWPRAKFSPYRKSK